MSSIANLGSASAALPQLSVHAHGHKKGAAALSTDPSSSDAAQPAATEDLFGNLLQSLEQVIGLQSGTASTASATPAATTPAGAAAGSAAAAPSASSANAQLQNYLHNAPRLQTELKNYAGTNVSVSA